MKSIKAIIFDYDDTLVRTREIKWEAIKSLALEYNLNLEDSVIASFWGTPFDIMLSRCLKNIDSIDNLKSRYFKISNKFPMKEHIQAVEIITRLIRKYKVGILTASDKTLTLSDLKLLNFPINEFFYIQTSEDTNIHKPNPLVFTPILKKLLQQNIFEQDILYIGDSTNDLRAAEGANINFIGILHGKENQFPSTTIVVNDFTGLLSVLL